MVYSLQELKISLNLQINHLKLLVKVSKGVKFVH